MRTLRRLDLAALVGSPAPGSTLEAARVLGVADVETTGLGEASRIVELAVRRLRVSDAGEILEIGRLYSFLEDPGVPLDPAVARLTGLSDADLVGQSIDEARAVGLFRSCEVVVCHNARFDAPRLRERLPLADLPFACSLRQVDWRRRGFGGPLTLGCLLCQSGLFAPAAHRAGADVDALIAMLAQRDGEGRTALREVLDNAKRRTLRFSAYGAAFGEPTALLKKRGYRWDSDGRVWSREVDVEARGTESAWLGEHVYDARWRPRCEGPMVEDVDWVSRFG